MSGPYKENAHKYVIHIGKCFSLIAISNPLVVHARDNATGSSQMKLRRNESCYLLELWAGLLFLCGAIVHGID